MKKLQLMAWPKLCSVLLLVAAALFTASCARDGFDNDETFDAGVHNTTVQTLTNADVTIEASADESQTHIKWNVIMGASKYALRVIKSQTKEVVKDSLVDGIDVYIPREEDTYYTLTIQPKGDASRGNSDGGVFSKDFNTFLPETKRIPPDSDLTTWIAENLPKVSQPKDVELYYVLEAGASYKMSGDVDLRGQRVTIGCDSKTNLAKLTIGAEMTFSTCNRLALKYIDIDATQMNKPLVTLSDTPDDTLKYAVKEGWYEISKPLTLKGCVISGLNTPLIQSNKAKYLISSIVVNGCVIEMAGEKASNVINVKAGYAETTQFQNSTVYSRTAQKDNFFINFGNRPKDLSESHKRIVTIKNCTLANLAYNKNFCNYHEGQTTFTYELLNCIIQDCGKSNFVTGLNKGQDSNNPTWNVNNNTFWRDGADVSALQTPDNCKWVNNNRGSNFMLTTDPGIDPANAKFSPAGAQKDAKQGDPRWF